MMILIIAKFTYTLCLSDTRVSQLKIKKKKKFTESSKLCLSIILLKYEILITNHSYRWILFNSRAYINLCQRIRNNNVLLFCRRCISLLLLCYLFSTHYSFLQQSILLLFWGGDVLFFIVLVRSSASLLLSKRVSTSDFLTQGCQ